MTRIALRNNLVTLQYPSNGSRNTVGHKEQLWTTHGDAWVSMEKTGGAEVEVDGQASNFSVIQCAVLYVDAPELTATWRMRTGSSEPYTYYNILSVDLDPFSKEWTVTVSKDDRHLVDTGVIEQ